MKDIIGNIFGFLYTLSMGDYIFFITTFILILCFIYVVFLIKRDDIMEETYYKNEECEFLNEVKEKIENEYEPSISNLSDYEEEQEKNAIISYEELVKNKDKFGITYDEKYNNENKEIVVKKINLDNRGTKFEESSELKVKLMSYDKEEAFLIALKKLQHNLTN